MTSSLLMTLFATNKEGGVGVQILRSSSRTWDTSTQRSAGWDTFSYNFSSLVALSSSVLVAKRWFRIRSVFVHCNNVEGWPIAALSYTKYELACVTWWKLYVATGNTQPCCQMPPAWIPILPSRVLLPCCSWKCVGACQRFA